MPDIVVNLGERSYTIHARAGVLREAGSCLTAAGLEGLPLFIVTDKNVAAALPAALDALRKVPCPRSTVVVIEPGEESKSMAGFSALMDQLAAFEDGDGVVVIALGGGVVGDLTGFVAACYKRGTPWVQVPTTLLSQVDASVGGKTAINHPTAKNLIGAFHQPRAVLADLDVLTTLPVRELRSGLAEVIKHGVIADSAFFERIEGSLSAALPLDSRVLEDYVATSCVIKGAVVEADEKDTSGRRAALNYGHTFGHAIELAAHFRYAHGEAIAIGMACAGDLAVRMELLKQADANRIEAVLENAGLPTRATGLSGRDVMAAMQLDKKFLRGSNRFVLAREIGRVELHRDVPEGLVLEVLQKRLA
ncbi:MAG: 3-dehydroquinate synthase [Armatimonadota bacterium]|nr:3-dehydroquinate synthase [Armatimonadota bacterium]